MIVLDTHALLWWALDRVIVATALGLGLPVLTKDAAMRSFEGVSCEW